MTKSNNVVAGVFFTRAEAETAIHDLRAAGFGADNIGMISRDAHGVLRREGDRDTLAEEGGVAGAVVGAGAGTLVGLAAISGTIPVLGPVLALGALGTVLLGAATGAAVLGLVGALIGMGMSEDEARYYEAEVQDGRFLVTVDAGNRRAEAWDIMYRSGAYNRTTPQAAAAAPI